MLCARSFYEGGKLSVFMFVPSMLLVFYVIVSVCDGEKYGCGFCSFLGSFGSRR